MFWPDGNDSTTDIKLSAYENCVGHGGSDVFPFGLLDSDIDGWTVRNCLSSWKEMATLLLP